MKIKRFFQLKIRQFFKSTVTINAFGFGLLLICIGLTSSLNILKSGVDYQCTVKYDSVHIQVVTIKKAKRMPKITLDGRTGEYVKCIELK